MKNTVERTILELFDKMENVPDNASYFGFQPVITNKLTLDFPAKFIFLFRKNEKEKEYIDSLLFNKRIRFDDRIEIGEALDLLKELEIDGITFAPMFRYVLIDQFNRYVNYVNGKLTDEDIEILNSIF